MHRVHLESIDSTNTYAKQHSAQFDPNQITLITAEEQTHGKGQFDRKWVSPKGVNLYATLYFTLPLNTPHVEDLALEFAKLLYDTLIEEQLHPTMKWPNDVLLNGKKIAGVLCETVFEKDKIHVILGFGLNVNMEKVDLQKIDQPATSLKEETGKIWDKESLLAKIIKKFSNRFRDC